MHQIQKDLNRIWAGWKITHFIGEGSFGKVYKMIRKDRFGHSYEAALKVIDIPQSQAELRSIRYDGIEEKSIGEYFYAIAKDIAEEFALMSKLKGNSNIVSYEDHAIVPQEKKMAWKIYIRMELLTPLFEYIEEEKFTITKVLQLGIDLCKALEICQQYNIIHRDIKPENIFVSNLGQFKLGDFGVARQMEKTMSMLSKKGTYTYMAPEVYKGQSYSFTSDIYSLGIVLYRFLNWNRTPFLPPYPEKIHYYEKEQALAVRIKGENIPVPYHAAGRLGNIILKACAYDPADRYQSAREMREALEQILGEESQDFLNTDVRPYDEMKKELDAQQQKESQEKTEKKEENTVYLFQEKTEKTSTNVQNDRERKKISEEPLHFAKNKKRLWMLVLFFVMVVGGVAIYQAGFKTKVPSFVNLTSDQAKEKAESDSLVLKEERKFSNSVKRGKVISQDILAGNRVKRGTVIHLVISKGKKIIVPSIIGKKQEDARILLKEKGLTMQVSSQSYSDTVKKGKILSQSVKKGKTVEEDTKIMVVVSKGIEPVTVPNVIGNAKDTAIVKIKNAKLRYETSHDYSNEAEVGTVIRQSAEGGSKIDKNSVIRLVISLGKRPVSSPSSSNNNTGDSGSSKNSRSTEQQGSSKSNSDDNMEEWNWVN